MQSHTFRHFFRRLRAVCRRNQWNDDPVCHMTVRHVHAPTWRLIAGQDMKDQELLLDIPSRQYQPWAITRAIAFAPFHHGTEAV